MLKRLSAALPLIGLTAAAALVVVLSLKVRDLNEQNSRLYLRARYPFVGMYVPTFRGATLTGDSLTIGETGPETRQVLFFFTTTCPYCKTTLPAWNQLAATFDTFTNPRVEVYGVSLDSVGKTRQYVAQNTLPFPVLHFPEEKLSAIYRAGSVPLTVVLDPNGRMVHARVGEMTEKAAIDSVVAAVKWKPEPRPAPAAQPKRAASR